MSNAGTVYYIVDLLLFFVEIKYPQRMESRTNKSRNDENKTFLTNMNKIIEVNPYSRIVSVI